MGKDQVKVVWIGLLHVKTTPETIWENLDEDEVGSYVQVLCLAKDKRDFHRQVMDAVRYYKVEFVTLEDIEIFSERLKAYECEEFIIEKSKEVLETGNPRFGIWHTYTEK